MAEIVVHSFGALVARLKRDIAKLDKAAHGAAKRTAKRAVRVIKENIPVAHGELRESVHTVGPLIVIDAPHAAAVNNGSRPHYPPLAPLIAWVKLRGTQGLLTDRQIGRLPGSSTPSAARSVAAMLRGHEAGGAMPTDAAEKVARAIQQAIGQHGTKPHHFVEKSMPEIFRILNEEMKRATGTPDAPDAAE